MIIRFSLIVFCLSLAACSPVNFVSPSAASLDKTVASQTVQNAPPAPSADPSGTVPADGAHSYEKQQCAWAKSIQNLFVSVADGATLTDSFGNTLFKGHHLASVKNFEGNLIFLGQGAGAVIDEVSGITGNLIICDADLTSLVQSLGNVVVINGKIGAVKDATGNILATQVGSLDHVNGNVVTLPDFPAL